MSKISIEGNASGTGMFTIAAPNTNSNYTLTLPTQTGTILTSATTTGFPAGSVLQVVSTTKTDTFTTTSTSFTDVTGLSVSITPSSASNKILVLYNFQASATSGENTVGFQLVRNSTAICLGTAAGSRFAATNYNRSMTGNNDQSWAMTMNFLDSPATTSSVTYKVQVLTQAGATAAVGRTVLDSNVAVIARFPSTITVMEIAG